MVSNNPEINKQVLNIHKETIKMGWPILYHVPIIKPNKYAPVDEVTQGTHRKLESSELGSIH